MTRKTPEKAKSITGRYARSVKDSAYEIWLAGLGAFAITGKESGNLMKKGSELFGRLVAEGEKFEKRTLESAREETAQASRRVRKVLGIARQPIAFHLLPEGEGWTVRREGSDENLSRHDTKNAALEAGRGLAHATLPSRLVVHRADGTIQTSYSYE